MKAISLWQPYASAMALDWKHNETRSWPTSYRGDLLICSAKRQVPKAEEAYFDAYFNRDMLDALPYGFGLCVVELFDCIPSDWFHGATPKPLSQTEAYFGDYTQGRWIWMTRNLRTLKTPLPIRGRQGLWTLTAEEVATINANL